MPSYVQVFNYQSIDVSHLMSSSRNRVAASTGTMVLYLGAHGRAQDLASLSSIWTTTTATARHS